MTNNSPSREDLIGLPHWYDIICSVCDLMIPTEFASQTPMGSLEWVGNNSASLVKRVSSELYNFPAADDTLFLALGLKKYRFAGPELAKERRESAIKGFHERNRRAAWLPLPSPHVRERMRMLLEKWLPYQGTAFPKFGPGAVAEHWSHARRWQVLDEIYGDSFESCQPVYVDAEDNLFFSAEVRYAAKHSVARLCAVPKDWNKDRLITVEPAILSAMQQAVRTSLVEAVHAGPLRGSAMDLYADGQNIQRLLALKGSVTKQLDTLDLSDASDNITVEFVYDVFPSWVTTLLGQTRSGAVFVEDGSRSTTPLHIYAGMGNATTFVIETLLFAAYVHAIAWQHGLKRYVVSVFGDDIICSSSITPYLREENDAFFRINDNKSFCGETDHLRESCGIYALDGLDVTPTRINGFANTFAGRLGLASWIQKNWEARPSYRTRLAYSVGRLAIESKATENWPFLVEGYPSISLDCLPYSPLPQTRRHRDFQTREAKLAIPSPMKVEVPSDARWALLGSLAGALRTTRRKYGDVVTFPVRNRWTPPRPRWLFCHP